MMIGEPYESRFARGGKVGARRIGEEKGLRPQTQNKAFLIFD